jgi:hypothetical protein
MKGLILIFTALSLFTGVALGLVPHIPLAAGQDDKAGVTSLLNDYARAYGKLDVQAILPYYHEPSGSSQREESRQCRRMRRWRLRSSLSWTASGHEASYRQQRARRPTG